MPFGKSILAVVCAAAAFWVGSAVPAPASLTRSNKQLVLLVERLRARDFTIIGDTNHADDLALYRLIASTGFMNAATRSGVKCMAFELPSKLQPYARQYWEGVISRHDFVLILNQQANFIFLDNQDALTACQEIAGIVKACARRNISVIFADKFEGYDNPLYCTLEQILQAKLSVEAHGHTLTSRNRDQTTLAFQEEHSLDYERADEQIAATRMSLKANQSIVKTILAYPGCRRHTLIFYGSGHMSPLILSLEQMGQSAQGFSVIYGHEDCLLDLRDFDGVPKLRKVHPSHSTRQLAFRLPG